MVIIQATTTFIQASGIQNLTVQGQGGGPTNTNTVVQAGTPSSLTDVIALGGFSNSNDVLQFGGISGNNDIASFLGISSAQNVFFSPESTTRSGTVFGVIGTSGTIEKFFDRSPFFFTPSETDPNTLRDLAEVQQFLLFSNTSIFGEESIRNTPSSTAVISAKGDEFNTFTLQPRNLITNGSFEQDLSAWEVSTGDVSDIAEARTDQPAGVGFDAGNPVSPVDGSKMLYMAKSDTTEVVSVKQIVRPGKLNSNKLQALTFSIVPNTISSNQAFVLSIAFLSVGVRQHVIQYKLTIQGTPTPLPSEISFPSSQISLTATADIFNTYTRQLQSDMSFSSFDFDEVQLWLVADTLAGQAAFLLDNISLSVTDLPEHLGFTESLAHILTNHPTASGFPFTISGSDDVNQLDQTGPFFDETSPVSGTTFNAPDAQVQFHIKDGGSSVDQATIDIFIDGLQVITAGTTVTGTTWPIASKTVLAPNNIEYIFTRGEPFLQQSVVTVSGQLADLATPANLTDDSYIFTVLGSGSLDATISGSLDADAPVIAPVNPVPGQTQVSPNTGVLWTTTDNASGVDPSTVKLFLNGGIKVNGNTAIDGSLARITNTSRGFDDTYIPDIPFTVGSTVTGTIEATDVSGNFASLTYEFTVTPTDTLNITNFFLTQNTSTLLTSGTEMSVCVEDFTHGVNVSGTSFTVNQTTPSGLFTVLSGTPTSGTGPSKVTFSIPLESLITFREDLVIFVHAENNFPGDFPAIKEQTFILRPGYGIVWPNKTEDQAGGTDQIFPYLTSIQVLTDVKNFAKNFGEVSSFFDFRIEEQSTANLGATLISNIEVADLSATLTSLNPFFVYGKTITLEIEADDLEGNQLRFTHIFTIEPKPT